MLRMINEYYVNSDNVAFLELWNRNDGFVGTIITFNSYAAAANCTDWNYEPLRIFIEGLNPTQVADFLNNEPAF